MIYKFCYYFLEEGVFMRKSMFLFVLLFVFLSGCTTTQKAATVGGVGGATIGGIIGHQ